MKTKLKNFSIFKFSRYFFYILVALLIVFTGFLFYKAYKYYAFIELSVQIKNNLEISVESLKDFQFEKARAYASVSKEKSEESLNLYNDIQDDFLFEFIASKQDRQDLTYILEGSNIVATMLTDSSELALSFQREVDFDIENINLSEIDIEQKEKILELIYKNTPKIQSIKSNTELALIKLEKVKAQDRLKYVKDDLEKVKKSLQSQSLLISKAGNFLELLPYIAGYPQESKFLIMLQNSDELRPTGGFFGSYAFMSIKNGRVENISTHDIYRFDSLVKEKIQEKAPYPVEKYLKVDNLYFRDLNWSPDWPETAERIREYYRKIYEPENQYTIYKPEEIDGVLAITPKFVEDLIDLTGEIRIEDKIYTSANFHELLQYEVEIGYNEKDIPFWERKQEIDKVLEVLKEKVRDMSTERYSEIIYVIENNLKKKNVILESSDNYLQELLEKSNWGGEVKTVDSDYFMFIDANLGAYKTDRVVAKDINYEVKKNAKGKLIATFRINYSHHGGFDWRTTRYRSYARLLVPKGSKLLEAKGITQEEADSYFNPTLNKQVFAGFVSIEPKQNGFIEFSYELPEDIAKSSTYSLYAQKQPGNRISNLKVEYLGNKNVKTYTPGSAKQEQDSVYWNLPLNTDEEITVILNP